MNWLKTYCPGLGLAFGLALPALMLGKIFPIIGGPVFAIILGILLNNTFGKPKITQKGLDFTGKKVLQWAIVSLGGSLSLSQVLSTGLESFPVMISTLLVAFIAAYIFGKILGIPYHLKILIGVGTAICGGSAIAAISPIIEAEDMEIAYSISTIFLFNIAAVLIFPPVGHWLGFSDKAFGLWAGTAINDTSSVVAASYAFSNPAGAYATIVKLTRTTMIIPISLIAALITALQKRKEFKKNQAVNYSLKKIFPWFILFFLIAALLNTLGIITPAVAENLSNLGKFMIVMALAAIGLNSNFREMIKTGVKPILLGLLVWIVVSFTSLIVQFLGQQI